jgi:hypothetical protein
VDEFWEKLGGRDNVVGAQPVTKAPLHHGHVPVVKVEVKAEPTDMFHD